MAERVAHRHPPTRTAGLGHAAGASGEEAAGDADRLSPVIVDVIFEALAGLRAEGKSLLLVEQYVERAIGIADYVYILQKGEIVFVGEPSQCASGVVFARYLGASA
jgi:ABC-type branched-subunit amino acid transport system ATPase component